MDINLVLGANGQDGTFLVRHLLARQQPVVGIDWHPKSRWRIDSPLFSYQAVDLREKDILSRLLHTVSPGQIFHVAAVHNSAGKFYENIFRDVLLVNVASVHELLEYIRTKPVCKLLYASSAKVFGTPLPASICESTKRKNQDLYSISKNTSGDMIEYYREKHGISGSVVFLFNHESELRPEDFFIPKILRCLQASLDDKNHATHVHSLEFHCDWGSAEEYAGIMLDILEKAPGEDFVLGSGRSTYARDLVQRLFSEHGLDYRSHVTERSLPGEVGQPPYQVNLKKLKSWIHRIPIIGIDEVCNNMWKAMQG